MVNERPQETPPYFETAEELEEWQRKQAEALQKAAADKKAVREGADSVNPQI